MIKFLFTGDPLPKWLFSYIEGPNLVVPEVGSFWIVWKWKGRYKMVMIGKGMFRAKRERGKNAVSIRALGNIDFTHIKI